MTPTIAKENLNFQFNARFPQHIYEELTKSASKHGYYKSYQDFIEKFFDICFDSKKKMQEGFELLDKYPELNHVKELIKDIFKLKAFRSDVSEIYGVYISYRISVANLIKPVIWCHELSKKNDTFSFIKEVPKQEYIKIFNFYKEKKEWYLHEQNFDSYIWLVKEGLLDRIDDLENILRIKSFDNTKTSLNRLISIFEYEPSENILNKFKQIYPIVHSQDPDFSGVSVEKFLQLVQKSNVSIQAKKELNELVNKEDSFIDISDNKFYIHLNVEKIMQYRKKQFGVDGRESGQTFILEINKIFYQQKMTNISPFDCFVDKEEDLKKAIHHAASKKLQIGTKAYLLKDLAFTYTDEQDKEKKKEFFKELINNLLPLSIESKQIHSFIDKYNFQAQLDNTLQVKQEPMKTIKRKI